jgi:hypothetical protein
MRRTLAGMAMLLAGLGCTKPAVIKPPKPVPPGTVLIQFTRPVKESLDLSLDGTRVPVEVKSTKRSFWRKDLGSSNLWITGLPPGKHRYFLSSPALAFGPDQGEFTVNADQGTFLVTFSQTFKAVLYGSPEALPPPDGLPGVKVVLEK